MNMDDLNSGIKTWRVGDGCLVCVEDGTRVSSLSGFSTGFLIEDVLLERFVAGLTVVPVEPVSCYVLELSVPGGRGVDRVCFRRGVVSDVYALVSMARLPETFYSGELAGVYVDAGGRVRVGHNGRTVPLMEGMSDDVVLEYSMKFDRIMLMQLFKVYSLDR